MKTEQVRLLVDFPNRKALSEFVKGLRAFHGLPDDAAVYGLDGLDAKAVTRSNTYIIRRIGERREDDRLVITNTETRKETV